MVPAYRNKARCNCCSADAIADLQQAVEVDPQAATGHNALGLAHCETGDFEAALACFNTAVEKAPLQAAFMNNRGLAHYHLGHLDQSLAVRNPRLF